MTCLNFTEFEAFAEAVQEASVTMRMRSLEEPKWSLQHATVGPLRVQQGYEGGGSIAEGATVGDGWAFYHQLLPVHANGQVATENEVFAAPPGGEFCLACEPRHEWLTVFVPTSLLFRSPQELEFASSARPQLLKPPPHVTRRFTSLVRRFLSAAEYRPQLLGSPVAVDSFRNELLAAAKDLFTGCQHSASRHFVRWHCQTKSTVVLATSHPDQTLSISDLARQGGVPSELSELRFNDAMASRLSSTFAFIACIKPGDSFARAVRTRRLSPRLPSDWVFGISDGSPVRIVNCSGNVLPRRFGSPFGYQSACGPTSRRWLVFARSCTPQKPVPSHLHVSEESAFRSFPGLRPSCRPECANCVAGNYLEVPHYGVEMLVRASVLGHGPRPIFDREPGNLLKIAKISAE